MIPPLDARGLLPPGRHECRTLADIEDRFATNAHRLKLLRGLQQFIQAELAQAAQGLALYIGGSYLSDKPDPGDIDCTIVMTMDSLYLRPGLLRLCADGNKGRIYGQYAVEFYPSIDDGTSNDFRHFFAYVGDKTAAAKNLDSKDLRGIVKVNTWTPQ